MKEIKTTDNMQKSLDNQALQPYHSLPRQAILAQIGEHLLKSGLISEQEKAEFNRLTKGVSKHG